MANQELMLSGLVELDEFCYRFNRRKFTGELYNRLLKACLLTKSLLILS